MATQSSTLAWQIPWTEEPGRLQSMGLLRVGHRATSLSFFTFMHWRRKWQPTPVFLPGESQGQGSLLNSSSNSIHKYGFPGGSADKKSFCNAEDTGDVNSILGLGRSPGGGNGNSFQYS